ncbi:MAG: phosphoribosylamine--glycine ligase [Gammaproteobacteria bacterium]
MNILIIGNGGREHALAWKVAQEPNVKQVFVAPGNAGTALEPKVSNVAIDALDIRNLVRFAKKQQVDLTIVGPEAPLAAGIVDTFTQAELACFGPTQAAARLESSKAYSKDFMQRHAIPTAHSATFENATAAKVYVQQMGTPIVIKADGLAAGKGVIIAQDLSQANTAIDAILTDHRFGQAGNRIVIEEFLPGEEASFIILASGTHYLVLASSQDHKARDNGDCGPNTGGMGAYSPAPIVTPQLEQHILNDIVEPTLRGLVRDGNPYYGFLYFGLMIHHQQAKVLEYNCRFGDPETQVILPRLQSPLINLCRAALNNDLAQQSIQWDPRACVGVVMTAGGYPDHYAKGDIITGLDTPLAPNQKIFHAGTRLRGKDIVTDGGRVLCVTALADEILSAQQQAYAVVKQLHWHEHYYRTDIGYRAIN